MPRVYPKFLWSMTDTHLGSTVAGSGVRKRATIRTLRRKMGNTDRDHHVTGSVSREDTDGERTLIYQAEKRAGELRVRTQEL